MGADSAALVMYQTLSYIEVLKGPGCALYGRSEPGGTVNIVTKKPQFEQQGELKLSLGSDNFNRVEGDYTTSIFNV